MWWGNRVLLSNGFSSFIAVQTCSFDNTEVHCSESVVDTTPRRQRAKDLPAFFISLASVSSQKFVPQTGAVLIKDASGEVIGAAGASGGTGDEVPSRFSTRASHR